MIFVDANIFMYAAGRPSVQREPSRAWLAAVVAGTVPSCCTDAEVLQELLHRYRAIGREADAFRVFDSVIRLGIPILSVGERESVRARRILEANPSLSTRDGVHVAVMEQHGLTEVLTYDRGFDAVSWLTRLEP